MQPITGIRLSIYKFRQYNFPCTAANAVHAVHPLHIWSVTFGVSVTLFCLAIVDTIFHTLIAGLADVRKEEILDEAIALLTVSATHLFKQGIQKATVPFCVGFQRLYDFCSFLITAFQFTTNEPQSYVLGG